MKKPLIVLALGFLALSLQAAFIIPGHPAFEPFADASASGGTTYATNSFLAGQTNAQGLPWFQVGTGTAQAVITNGALSYPGLLQDTGNSIVFGGATSSISYDKMDLNSTISGSTNQSLYYSMLFSVTNLAGLTGSGVFVAGYNNTSNSANGGTAPTVIGARLYVRATNGGYNLGINKADGTATDIVWDFPIYTVGTTYFVVGAYNFSGAPSSSNDTVSLWVDPASNTFGTTNTPPADVITAAGANIQTGASESIASFVLRNNSSAEPVVVLDELSVGLTWADVTPIPTSALLSPVFTNLNTGLTATYGTSVIVSGTVVAPGPTYPNLGEAVTVSVNGNQMAANISDPTGDFSFSYNPKSTPVSSTPYTITYAYNGDGLLAGVTNKSTTMFINTPLTATLSGARAFDSTANVAAGTLFVANALSGDNVFVASGSGTLAGSVAGTEAITSVGTLALGGTSASNYTLSGSTGNVTISSPFITAGHPIFEPFSDATASGGTSYTGALVGQTNAQDVSWFAAGASGGSQPILTSGTLTYPGLLPVAGPDSVIYSDIVGVSARLNLGTASSNSINYGGSAYNLYYSILLNLNSLGNLSSTPSFIAGFNNSTGSQTNIPTVFGARLYTRLSGGGYNLGVDKFSDNTNDIIWETNIYNVNTTYFIVVDYAFSGTPALTNDTVSLWVDPPSSSFGGTAPAPDVSTSSGINIGSTSTTDQASSFILREANTSEPGTINVDELSIGVTWADVTPPAATTTFKITSAHVVGGNFVLTWQSTPNSTYQVLGSPTLLTPAHTWTNVGSQITATGTSTSATNPISGPMNFYSVVTP